MNEKLYLGVEIGGTKLQVVLGNDNADILDRRRFVVDAAQGGAGIRGQIAQALSDYLRHHRLSGTKGARFITELKDLDAVSKALKNAGWKISASEMRYLAKNFPEVPEQSRKDVLDFLHELDDHDDVHHVYAALK